MPIMIVEFIKHLYFIIIAAGELPLECLTGGKTLSASVRRLFGFSSDSVGQVSDGCQTGVGPVSDGCRMVIWACCPTVSDGCRTVI